MFSCLKPEFNFRAFCCVVVRVVVHVVVMCMYCSYTKNKRVKIPKMHNREIPWDSANKTCSSLAASAAPSAAVTMEESGAGVTLSHCFPVSVCDSD